MHLGYYAEAQIEVSMVIPDDRYGVIPVGKVFRRYHLAPGPVPAAMDALHPALPKLAVKAAALSFFQHELNAMLPAVKLASRIRILGSAGSCWLGALCCDAIGGAHRSSRIAPCRGQIQTQGER